MPLPRSYVNAFNAGEVARISGLSVHMVSYLAKAGFLLPEYRSHPPRRGSTRYYCYRDLVVARIVSSLLGVGVEIKRLKQALRQLQEDSVWSRLGPHSACALLVTDGSSIMVREADGSITDLTRGGQGAFAFVIDLGATDADIRTLVDPTRLKHFNYEVMPLKLADQLTG